jgi:hypothetical protein
LFEKSAVQRCAKLFKIWLLSESGNVLLEVSECAEHFLRGKMSSKPETQDFGKTFQLFESEDPSSQNGRQGQRVPPLETRELGDAVVRRTRSLITPGPILEIERSKSQRDLDLSKHDLRMLCLVALDVAIDKMGFGTGGDRHDIASAMTPILRAADPGLAREVEDQIIDLVLNALLNERDRRQQFVERYGALEDGSVVWREFAYRLLEERQLPDSEERVFRASSEAINLYTEMLGYNLEDAAQADLAVLKYQSDRGRLDDAIHTARQAQIRAKAYAEKIRMALELARRDADQARWTSEIVPVISQALGHIGDRLHKEGELRGGLEQRRDLASNEDLKKINRLLVEIEKSEHTNLELHKLLLTANDSYREEHSRQRLRRLASGLHVNLQAELLLPWLGTEVRLANELVSGVLNTVAGHGIMPVTGLEQMWSRLLAPPLQASIPEADVTMPATEPLQQPPPIFTADEHRSVRDFLRAELGAQRTLGELLLVAGDRGLTSPAKRLFVLLTMQQFGAVGDQLQIRVRPSGAPLSCGAFSGDDLELSRLEQ